MFPNAPAIREDALAIWQAGVDAVRSDVLVRAALRIEGSVLQLEGRMPSSCRSANRISIDLQDVDRVVVVGAGKAGAGMALATEEVFGEAAENRTSLSGWVNVPEGCVRPTRWITLHAARPPGVNEPRAKGVAGTRRILELIGSLGPRDLCLCLLSGGGSALLPAPAEGITLEDKIAVTRFLSAAGATIAELNCVRKQLSAVKGGRLAQACRAGHLVSLIISDVIGDRLDVIASGPTVPDDGTPAEALEILANYKAKAAGISDRVFTRLRHAADTAGQSPTAQVANLIIGNNDTAAEAARREAQRRGYRLVPVHSGDGCGEAEEEGRWHARLGRQLRQAGNETLPMACITGGEPVVRLVPEDIRGRGGRNQQLALAAVTELWNDGGRDIVVLSGGTDGEDGPTDAAGAVCDEQVISQARSCGLDPFDYLRRNDGYHFFEPLGGLIRTGATDTNVCDLRVVLVAR